MISRNSRTAFVARGGKKSRRPSMMFQSEAFARVASSGIPEEPLPFSRHVVRDHAGGCVENVPRGTIVLLELDDSRAGKVALEIQDVVDVGAAESINRLIFVADRNHISLRARQRF